MVSNHDLPPEIRFLLLCRSDDAGMPFLLVTQDYPLSDAFQLLILVLQTNSAEFGLTIAAIPIVLTLLVICGVALKREIKWYINFVQYSSELHAESGLGLCQFHWSSCWRQRHISV